MLKSSRDRLASANSCGGLQSPFSWRRRGKKKPPVQLGVDKKSYSKRKDLLW